MYIELHARSAFSFLEGASVPEELASVCAEHGMPAMALLDRDGVYGSPRFHLAAKKLSIRAHIGAEVTSAAGWRYPLLVESREGYQNLCRLITRMKLRARKGEGSVQPEEIAAMGGGLICLTGGDEGPLAHALAQGGIGRGHRMRAATLRAFGRDNVYVELQRHFCREEEARNQAAVEIARKLKLAAAGDQRRLHALPQQRGSAGRLHLHPPSPHARNRRPPAEPQCRAPFEDRPRRWRRFSPIFPKPSPTRKFFPRACNSRCNDLGYQFPEISGSRRRVADAISARAHARRHALPLRLRIDERARQQIDRELALIEKLDLAGYFLIVWDIVRFCREQNILVQGRGSAANSAVCYALGITAVDPVGMDLLFERFLSEERGEWPDIDLDLPSGDQRERAIQYVYERYGKLGAAMTANVITYRGRSAAREIGKASVVRSGNARPPDSAWWGRGNTRIPSDTLDRQFRDAGLDLQHPRIRKFFELCQAVQDLPRHLGQHSGGMVVCQGQLDSVVPLEPATMPGRVVVQWDKEDCADMGIVKVDLLGLGMMAVLEDSLQDHSRALWRRSRSRPSARRRSRCLCGAAEGGHGRACFRSKAARRCPACRACARNVFTTSSCRWRSSAPGRSSGKWCIPI